MKFETGLRVNGKINNIVDFGIFVDLPKRHHGLIHESDFGEKWPSSKAKFEVGQELSHHVYINEKYVNESLFYEECPTYISGNCTFMPNECFAVSFLDEEKIKRSFGFTNSPL